MARRPRPRPRTAAASRAALAGLAALLALGAVAPAASAYRLAGSRWPNETIAVANQAPRYEPALRSAIRAWNRARVGVRFTRVEEPELARVVFRYGRGRGGGALGCEGLAGGTGAGYPSPFARLGVVVLRSCGSPALRRLTAAHELGHVLGLGHEDGRCALMNSTGDVRTKLPAGCGPGPLIRRDDLRGARALYRREPPQVDPRIALFDPGHRSRRAWRAEAVRFGVAVRNPALEYRWDFGDPGSGAANQARGLEPEHAYAAPGRYTITLEVRDGGTPIATARQRLELF